MVKQVLAYGLVAGLAGILVATPTPSDAGIFKKAMVNGKLCRVEGKNPHFHVGVSRRYYASKKDALARAIHKWNRFAAWEYGPAYGDFHNAEKKSIDCALGISGKKWACAIKGQPCSK